MQILKIAQHVPPEYYPNDNTPVLHSVRVTNTTGRSYKEYIIRIYRFDHEYESSGVAVRRYIVIAWNGRIGGTLTPRYKGEYDTYSRASREANIIARQKMNQGYQYNSGNNFNYTDNRLRGVLTSELASGNIQESPTQNVQPPIPPENIPTPHTEQDKIETPIVRENEEDRIRRELFQNKTVPLVELIRQPDPEHYNSPFIFDIIDELVNIDKLYTKQANLIDYEFAFAGRRERMDDIVHALFSNDLYKNRALDKLSEDFFKGIRMTKEDRITVEQHFKKEEEQSDIIVPKALGRMFSKTDGWYKQAINIEKELTGHFKIKIKDNNGEDFIGNIWWNGYGENVKIINHNIPDELFRSNLNDITILARKESELAREEVFQDFI